MKIAIFVFILLFIFSVLSKCNKKIIDPVCAKNLKTKELKMFTNKCLVSDDFVVVFNGECKDYKKVKVKEVDKKINNFFSDSNW
jgi:hypothetical protein